jgi:hypothetical protein
MYIPSVSCDIANCILKWIDYIAVTTDPYLGRHNMYMYIHVHTRISAAFISLCSLGLLRIRIPCRFPRFLRPAVQLHTSSFPLRSLWSHIPKLFKISAGLRYDLDSPQWNSECFTASLIVGRSLFTYTDTYALSYHTSSLRLYEWHYMDTYNNAYTCELPQVKDSAAANS